MGRSRYKIYDISLPHFLTMTVIDWLPIFANPDVAEIVLESMRRCNRKLSIYITILFVGDMWMNRAIGAIPAQGIKKEERD